MSEQNVYVKDLNILLNNRTLKDIVIVDNKVESYSSNLENGIPITSFYGKDDNQMLLKLHTYVMKLKDVEDVREMIRNDFYISGLTNIKRD